MPRTACLSLAGTQRNFKIWGMRAIPAPIILQFSPYLQDSDQTATLRSSSVVVLAGDELSAIC